MSSNEAVNPPPDQDAAVQARRAQGLALTQQTQAGFTHELGVPYGDHPRQHTDFYYPAGTPRGPVLVFLHGGGFRLGDPGTVGHYGLPYLQAGVIFAAVGYRLLPDARIEDSTDDVEQALVALAARVAERGGDPDQIYVSGHSAGAMLAASVGLRPSAALPADLIKGLVLISGGYYSEQRSDEMVNRQSPRYVPNLVDHVANVPGHTIVVVGDDDFPGLLSQAEALTGSLRAQGGSVEMFVEPQADHFEANRSFISGSGPVFEATKVMMKL